jgi:molecular chaperone Hsp33
MTLNHNEDYLVKALCLEDKVRIYACRTTMAVSEAQQRHDTWATATAALGRTLTVGAMMGAMVKGNEKVTLQVRGDGPLGKLIVDAQANGVVRGYVDHPHVNLPLNEQGKLDVGRAVGQAGEIVVTKDLNLKEPYVGRSPLVNGEIGDDFTLYFAQSEQTPSAVAVGVMVNSDHTVKASGGYMLQLMPGVPDVFISQLEERLQTVMPVSRMVDLGYTPEQMIETVLEGTPIHWLSKQAITYQCTCSIERVEQTLISLGQEELQAMIKEDGKAEVSCQFCRAKYFFTQSDLEALLQQTSR